MTLGRVKDVLMSNTNGLQFRIQGGRLRYRNDRILPALQDDRRRTLRCYKIYWTRLLVLCRIRGRCTTGKQFQHRHDGGIDRAIVQCYEVCRSEEIYNGFYFHRRGIFVSL